MRQYLAYALASCVLALLAADAVSKDGPSKPVRQPPDKIQQSVSERIEQRGGARVIVHLNTPVVRERTLSTEDKVAQREAISDAQQRFASELSAAGAVADKIFSTVPAVALRADAAVLDVLTRSGLVETVTLDLLARPFLHESNQVIESDHMWTQNPAVKGAGHAVAILDTGVDSTHPMFADSSGHTRVAADFCASTNYTDESGTEVSTSFCPGGAATSLTGSGADCAEYRRLWPRHPCCGHCSR